MMLKILIVHKQKESTVEERSLSTLFKSIGVDILLSFTVSLFNFCHGKKNLKNTLETSLLRIRRDVNASYSQ
jgi:hypothetical protein